MVFGELLTNHHPIQINTKLTPLMMAASDGNVICLNQLINSGVEVNATDDKGSTALFYASNSLECTKSLIQAGANVSVENYMDSTPLIEAMWSGNIKVAQELITHGADVNQTTRRRYTALYEAAEDGFITEVEFLLQSGANPNIPIELNNNTPLTVAALNYNEECMGNILKCPSVDVNVIGLNGTALIISAFIGSLRMVRMLLHANAFINITNNIPYFTSQETQGNKEAMTLLFSAGEQLVFCELRPIENVCSDDRLINLCRKRIREHLLEVDHTKHLFWRIPLLSLPTLLQSYLLYDLT